MVPYEVDGVETWMVYDGENVWADFDEDGDVVARYLVGIREDELWARWQPGNGVNWYVQDRMFSVRGIVNADGQLVDVIDYDAFGGIVSESDASEGDRYKYTGREWESVTGLYHYRARGYDPESKTFLQEDMLGLSAGDTNEYRYSFNQPTNLRDPSGLTAMGEYGNVASRIAGSLVGSDVKFCASDRSMRVIFSAEIMGTELKAEIGRVIADYGITVPKTDLLTLCVESCADLLITAYSNGVFGAAAISLDWFVQLGSGLTEDQLVEKLEYAEPNDAMGLWSLRVSAECGQRKLQAASASGGGTPPAPGGDVPGSPPIDGTTAPGQRGGSTKSGSIGDGGWKNGTQLQKTKLHRTRAEAKLDREIHKYQQLPLRQQPGVAAAAYDIKTGKVQIGHNDRHNLADIERAMRDPGFRKWVNNQGGIGREILDAKGRATRVIGGCAEQHAVAGLINQGVKFKNIRVTDARNVFRHSYKKACNSCSSLAKL